jgi:hypothetical protein
MNSNAKYPGFQERFVGAIRKRAPSINAVRAQARKPALDMVKPKGFTVAFNERFEGSPLLPRSAGNWLKGKSLPSNQYRVHVEWLLREDWYFLEHGVRTSNSTYAYAEAAQPVVNYIELPASLQIDPAIEMLAAEQKEPIKGIVRQLNLLIDGLLKRKRPD